MAAPIKGDLLSSTYKRFNFSEQEPNSDYMKVITRSSKHSYVNSIPFLTVHYRKTLHTGPLNRQGTENDGSGASVETSAFFHTEFDE